MLLSLAASLSAQAAAPAPHFEVASIRPTPNPGGRGIPLVRSGRWVDRNVTAAALIAYAYNLHCCNLVEGGPKWLDKTGFAIEATVDTKTVPDAVFRLMLQHLLATRFQLKMHEVTRIEPAYVLEIAPSGSKLRPATAPCDPNAGAVAASVTDVPRCGLSTRASENKDEFILVGRSATMPEWASALESMGAEPRAVVDRTGLTGKFDFEFTFHLLNSLTGAPPMTDPEAAHANMAAFSKDMRVQLGLKFDPFHTEKAPLPVAVVDAIAMPWN